MLYRCDMKILVVDTASENMVIGLSSEDKIYSFIGGSESKLHNSQIVPSIDRVLGEAGINIKDVDYFACVAGPGSFTGIRIGVSSVKALAFACGKKCVSINALEELAFGTNENEFYAAIDCRHDSFYYAAFRGSYENMVAIGEMTRADLEKKTCVVYKSGASNPRTLIEIAKRKIAAGDFTDLSPIYLKKSQAEREYELKNMDKTV